MLSFELVIYEPEGTRVVDSFSNILQAVENCLELDKKVTVPVELHVYKITEDKQPEFLHDITPDFIKKTRKNL